MSDRPQSIDANSPEATYLNKLHASAFNLRGGFIDQAIWIDLVVTDILARYFVPDVAKRALLASEVITGPDSSFSGRINVLRKVVSRSYPAFATQYPALFDRLDKIRRFRNRLAHAHLDTGDDFLAKEHMDRVQLVFYEDGETKTQVVTFEEFRARLAECSEIVKQLLALQGMVSE
jgi:hypothetical protein